MKVYVVSRIDNNALYPGPVPVSIHHTQEGAEQRCEAIRENGFEAEIDTWTVED